MRLREKVLWTVLVLAMIIGFVIIPLGKSVYYNAVIKPAEVKKSITHELENTFKAMEVDRRYLNYNEDGLIEEPYYLEDIQKIQPNHTNLQIRVNAYNNHYNDTLKKVDRETLEKEFEEFLKSGNMVGDLSNFIGLWEVHEGVYNGYRRDIGGIFNEYTKIYSNYPINKLEDLTPEQINKLDEVYRGEKTIEEIKL